MEYVQAVRRNWLVALLVVLLVMIPTALVTALTPAQYTATTRLWVGVAGGQDITDLNQKVSVATDLMSTYPELVKSPLVLDKVIAELGLPTTAASLSQEVTPTVPNDTFVLSVAVTDPSSQRSAEIANSVARHFAASVAALPQVSAGASQTVDATVLQVAQPPSSPSSPQVVRNLGVAFVLSLVLAVLACLVVARLFPNGFARKRRPTPDSVPEWH
jgi:succinoglycan biosynthesis transport protein ExoP